MKYSKHQLKQSSFQMSKQIWKEDETAFHTGFQVVLFYLQTSLPGRHNGIYHVKFLMSFLPEGFICSHWWCQRLYWWHLYHSAWLICDYKIGIQFTLVKVSLLSNNYLFFLCTLNCLEGKFNSSLTNVALYSFVPINSYLGDCKIQEVKICINLKRRITCLTSQNNEMLPNFSIKALQLNRNICF